MILGIGSQTHFNTEEISDFILERGEVLREFDTNSVLPTQAIVHNGTPGRLIVSFHLYPGLAGEHGRVHLFIDVILCSLLQEEMAGIFYRPFSTT